MVKVRIEMFTFGNIHSIGRLVVISSHNVIDIIDGSWSISDLGEICWPDSAVGILSLVLRYIRSVNMITNYSVSVVPFLIIVLLVVMVSRIDSEHRNS